MSPHRHLTAALLLLLALLLALFMVLERYFTDSEPRKDRQEMAAAVDLVTTWFFVIDREKCARNVPVCADSDIPYRALIGEEFSAITTSLGSLEAKEIAANPEFAALTVRLLHDAGLHRGDPVAVAISGSFPALALSVLAAIQTLELEPVIFSSLGASNYGANQPAFTWLDMEMILRQQADLRFTSALVTPGGDDDNRGGLLDSSFAAVEAAAQRHGRKLYVPASLDESIATKLQMLQDHKVRLFINIGGNQSALGGCAHGAIFPNGYHDKVAVCRDKDRGLLMRCIEWGIPVLHFLNIKDLAARYQMDLAPGRAFHSSLYLYQTSNVKKVPALFSIGFLIVSLFYIRMRMVKK